ncbi:helix-turn-helix domain-containing protein [Spartinivicinus ruber]|uniref:helix-turn-helix domain-containing protein n=1 Tax=Spartinivicinus ruber TaxID=2683272 RepID=UPI0013D7DDD6|nr:helix-turn-helix domain-containing protein [Spartinivicinus ruber]
MIESQISTQLDSLMRRSGVDEKTLSKLTGVPIATISRLLNNHSANPTVNTLVPIAKFFNVSIDQLLGLNSTRNSQHTLNTLNDQAAALLPVIVMSALNQYLSQHDTTECNRQFEWIRTGYRLAGHGLAVKIDTDFYSPSFQKDSVIIVDCEIQAQNGDIILLSNRLDGGFYIRQYFRDNNDEFIRTINPDIVKTEILDQTTTKILGVVVETQFSFRGLEKQTCTSKSVFNQFYAWLCKSIGMSQA